MHLARPAPRALAAVPALIALAIAPVALASGGPVAKTGNCSLHSQWRLKASPDNGRLTVEAEVDSSGSGQKWAWKLKHNGSVSATGTGTTDSSDSFKVTRVLVDLAGTDTIVFIASYAKTGETCRGSIVL